MTEFVNMWKNYVNFKDRTTVRGYWMAFLINFIVAMVLSILFVVILDLMVVYALYVLAVLLPGLAIQIRRLRDAGKPWTWIFIMFIPCVGIILYIIALCKPSVPDDGVPVV